MAARSVRRRVVLEAGVSANANTVLLYDTAPTRWSSPRQRRQVAYPSVLPRAEVGAVAEVHTDTTDTTWLRLAGQHVRLGDPEPGSVSGVNSWAAATRAPVDVAHPMVDGNRDDLVRRRPARNLEARGQGRAMLLTYLGTGLLIGALLLGDVARTEAAAGNPVPAVGLGVALLAALGAVVAWLWPRSLPWRRPPTPSSSRTVEVWAWWSIGIKHAVEPWVTVVAPGATLSWPLHGDVTALHGQHAEDEPTTWEALGALVPGARIRLQRGGVELRPSAAARDDVAGPARPGRLAWPEGFARG